MIIGDKDCVSSQFIEHERCDKNKADFRNKNNRHIIKMFEELKDNKRKGSLRKPTLNFKQQISRISHLLLPSLRYLNLHMGPGDLV